MNIRPPHPEAIIEPTGGFRREVEASLGALRSACAAALAELPSPVPRAIDLERVTGLSKKLAWQVHALATADDVLAAGSRVPSSRSLDGAGEVLVRCGVGERTVEALREAGRRFEALVDRHAPDRASFDTMLAELTGESGSQDDTELKRSAFRANARIYGLHAETLLNAWVVRPGAKPNTIDGVSVRGPIGLHRIRSGVAYEISRHRFDETGGVVRDREPLVPDEGDSPVSLLREFCSSPLPQIAQDHLGDGFVRCFLQPEGLGRRSAVTALLADVVRGAGLTSNARGEKMGPALGHLVRLATPARRLVHDLIVDEAVCGGRVPELRVMSVRDADEAWPEPTSPRVLPISERVLDLGEGLTSAASPHVPRYAEVLGSVVECMGWDGARFRVFRVQIDYPVLGSTIWLRLDLA
jgi:hypothetical protein